MKAGARLARAAGVALLFVSCGGGGPVGPNGGTPTPTPTPAGVPGGVVNGAYLLRIEPAASCHPPRSVLTFHMNGHPTDGGLRPGVQVVLEFNPYLEMEFQYATPNLVGNIATSDDGVSPIELPNNNGAITFIYATLAGTVTSENGGPGQVAQGTMVGDVAFGDQEATCFSNAHHWSLKLQ